LNSLPEEPLHAGEKYYLDLAGNIRKGPVGVGYTCYCAPFFKELEARLDHNTKKLKRQICRTEDNINRRLCSMEKQLKRSNENLQQVNNYYIYFSMYNKLMVFLIRSFEKNNVYYNKYYT